MSEESKSSTESFPKAPETGRMTNRSTMSETARTEASIPQTFRTEMSTARVHTVLAALTAEKQALLAKLNAIDSTLETEKKRKLQASLNMKTRK